jgi:uncharacterized protein
MNVMHRAGPMEMVVVALQPGEMLLESIREAIRKLDIRNGAVVSGIGTLKNLSLHYIKHTDFPPTEGRVNIERHLELLSVSGIIADGEPHLHVVVSCERDEMYGGHLEEKSEVAYLAEIAILRCDRLEMARHMDERRKIRLLGPK